MSRSVYRRPIRIAVLSVSCALLSAGIVQPATAASPDLRLSQLNQRVFWNGANITKSGPDDWAQVQALAEMGVSACQHPDVECFDYELVTGQVPPASELRVVSAVT